VGGIGKSIKGGRGNREWKKAVSRKGGRRARMSEPFSGFWGIKGRKWGEESGGKPCRKKTKEEKHETSLKKQKGLGKVVVPAGRVEPHGSPKFEKKKAVVKNTLTSQGRG